MPGKRKSRQSEMDTTQNDALNETDAKVLLPADWHPLIALARKRFRSAKKSYRDILVPRSKDYVDIRTYRSGLERALIVANSIVKAFEARGHGIRVESGDEPKTIAIVDGLEVEFYIEETLNRTKHVPTKKEIRESQNKYFGRRVPEWDYNPSGKFSLKINVRGHFGYRSQWTEGKRINYEVNPEKAVVGVERQIEYVKDQARRWRHQEWAWEIDARVRRQRERKRELEAQREEEFLRDAEQWSRTHVFRQYLQACEQTYTKTYGKITPGSPIAGWLEWGREFVNSIDPLAT